MYTLISTYHEDESGNVGDHLLTHRAKQLIKVENNDNEFITFDRREVTQLESNLEQVRISDGVILPGFAIRDPIIEIYPVLDILADLDIPLIPLGAGWKSYPGDIHDLEYLNYSPHTLEWLSAIQSQISTFSVRTYFVQRILNRHGIADTTMTGDLGWYDPRYFGDKMHTPSHIDRLVFSTPHASRYIPQAKRVLKQLSDRFPDADRYTALHSNQTHEHSEIQNAARRYGFEIRDLSNDIENFEFYSDIDLHCGYRVHGHITSLSKRRPSVLIAEDGRGVGFGETLPSGVFHGVSPSFNMPLARQAAIIVEGMVSKAFDKPGLAVGSPDIVSSVDMNLPDRVIQFIDEELEAGWRRYRVVPEIIDKTYDDAMQPVLKEIGRIE